MSTSYDDSLSAEAADAIRKGEVQTLARVLSENPGLVKARIDGKRTLLHVATDWPGHFPNHVASVVMLIDRGADVNAAFIGNHSETPLHWAASTDDIPVLDASLAAALHSQMPLPSANGRQHDGSSIAALT
jgi:hypothetical protein